jgi:hypothetical protein
MYPMATRNDQIMLLEGLAPAPEGLEMRLCSANFGKLIVNVSDNEETPSRVRDRQRERNALKNALWKPSRSVHNRLKHVIPVGRKRQDDQTS